MAFNAELTKVYEKEVNKMVTPPDAFIECVKYDILHFGKVIIPENPSMPSKLIYVDPAPCTAANYKPEYLPWLKQNGLFMVNYEWKSEKVRSLLMRFVN